MKKKIFAVAMALCLLAGTSAMAQEKKTEMTKERPTPEQMAQRRTDRMTEKLNLNADQAKQVYAFNLEQVKQMHAQREQMRTAHKAEMEKMKSILTPEQFKQWKEMQGPEMGAGHHGQKGQMHKGKQCAGKECQGKGMNNSKK